jgi:uncharacterized protein YmfQ (DUF2313 family)
MMTSTAGAEMLKMLPVCYDSENTSAVIDVEGQEFDYLKLLLLFIIDQIFVETASDWGLDRWEQELDLQSYAGKPDDQRRSRIMSKMRGVGTVTINLIKSVAEAYDGGLVDVSTQPASYQFTVQFIDTRGVPPNINDLMAAVDEIKPAHLAVVYEYRYLIWNELDAREITWDELDALNLIWNEFELGGWL